MVVYTFDISCAVFVYFCENVLKLICAEHSFFRCQYKGVMGGVRAWQEDVVSGVVVYGRVYGVVVYGLVVGCMGR